MNPFKTKTQEQRPLSWDTHTPQVKSPSLSLSLSLLTSSLQVALQTSTKVFYDKVNIINDLGRDHSNMYTKNTFITQILNVVMRDYSWDLLFSE